MPDGNNVDATVMKLAKDYQASKVRSNNENEIRAEIRSNVEKIGIDPTAFQHGLRMAEDLTTGERSDYTGSLTRVLSILDGNEADLFGEEEMRKRDERKAKAAEKAAKAANPPSTDDNPKSNPKKGGAGGVDGRKPAKDATAKKPANKVSKRTKADTPPEPGTPAGDGATLPDVPEDEPIVDDGEGPAGETGDEMIKRVSAKLNAAREQREGAVILDGPGSTRKSQSQQSAEILETLGLDKGV